MTTTYDAAVSITDADYWTVRVALRLAAEKWDRDAADLAAPPVMRELARQQAVQHRAVLARMDADYDAGNDDDDAPQARIRAALDAGLITDDEAAVELAVVASPNLAARVSTALALLDGTGVDDSVPTDAHADVRRAVSALLNAEAATEVTA